MRKRRRPGTLGSVLSLGGTASLMLELLGPPGLAQIPHIGVIAAGLALLLVTGIAFDLGLVNSVLAAGGLVILLALMGWILGLLLGWRPR